jgi:hypothetical protein
VRHTSVTAGQARVRLAKGQSRTVSVALNTTGRRLLARFKRLPVRLTVYGTVVGAISGSLASQRLLIP